MTTDPDSILQLGIEAARDGNKEEARNLFRLLTREDSQNVQAWLWLAGVAESREERQAALERVIELDPQNDMALKSLQSLKEEIAGAPPSEPSKQPDVKETAPAAPASEPSPPPSRTMPEDDFDDPFAELDSLSDIFSEDPRAVGREEEEEEQQPSDESSQAATAASIAGGTVGSTDSASTSSKAQSASTGTDSDKSTRKTSQKKSSYVSQPPLAKSAWASSASSSSSSSSKRSSSKSPMDFLSSANMRLVLGGVAGILVIVFLWLLVWPRVSSLVLGGGDVAGPTAPQQGQGPAVSQTDQTPAPAVDDAATPEPAMTPETPAPEATVPEAPTAPQPTEPPTDQTGMNLDAMNPAIIPENTPLESNGWLYDYNQAFCYPAACTRVFRGNVAGFTPQGRFVHVLVVVANRTGQDQPIPPDFFVLKDAQGRVYKPLPELSKAFVMPGINADRSHMDPVPANGITTSVALFFDIASDATQVVFFSPTRPDQGWMVLERAQ